ncbi:VOC family protein [Methylovirgula sp. 4M-Z18]|uniref:VOC family protein n=1 Tax=Methylovirgula sp. 4M-Z18 TaxID=2293567 RepID=UPI000E2F3843|nr:VOC family protein [Methylovirgula sp. 4M-Z18]RFB75000.1 VOC family protein [Methylovirgula sp. 4M-Z18]
MTDGVNPIPNGMHTVTPHLMCGDALDAIEFYKTAFGAKEESRLVHNGFLLHAMLRIGDSAIMMSQEMPERGGRGPKLLGGTACNIHLYVEDADAQTAQAVAAGAKVIMPVSDMFWGDRYGIVEDPFGHHWSIATHVRDVTPDEMQKAVQQMQESGCA